MCEFCLKHGEGKKWYLQAKNYSDDLLSDVRRRKFVEKFFTNVDALAEDARRLEKLEKAPSLIRGLVRRIVTRRMKKDHFGQVVPIEEIEEIFGFVNSIIRVACICRHITLGEEKRYCYGISLAPDGGKLAEILGGLDESFLSGPDTKGFETVTKDEAISAFRDHEQQGLCHTVWTFQAPFIGGICNCDRADCLAMHATVTQSVPVMFRAEYVAEIDPDECSGCRECMRVCQFGAISYSAASGKAVIDQKRCYGCGVCRSVCKKDAIRLEERVQVPAAANLW
ncbi:MAG: 4Fe-4S ferredoxin [Latescibacteria bacterium DG_63]|nr:MAG: 4Fe-4S ferredoxin [Latescibacteria bacterium DG_63]